MNELLKIGTRVTHFDGGPDTHGLGVIVGYNGIPANHIQKNFEMALGVDAAETARSIAATLYDCTRCPYIVRWDPLGTPMSGKTDGTTWASEYPLGYQDAYEPESIVVSKEDYDGAARETLLLAALRDLKIDGPYATASGICSNVGIASRRWRRTTVSLEPLLAPLIAQWPERAPPSNADWMAYLDADYPVPHPDMSAMDAYSLDDLWADDAYGAARRRLLDFLINCLDPATPEV